MSGRGMLDYFSFSSNTWGITFVASKFAVVRDWSLFIVGVGAEEKMF